MVGRARPWALFCLALLFFAAQPNAANSQDKEPPEKIEAFLIEAFLNGLVESSGARWFRYFHVPPQGAGKPVEGKERKSLDPEITFKSYSEASDGKPSPQQAFDEFWEKVVKPAAAGNEPGVLIRDAIHDPNGEWVCANALTRAGLNWEFWLRTCAASGRAGSGNSTRTVRPSKLDPEGIVVPVLQIINFPVRMAETG